MEQVEVDEDRDSSFSSSTGSEGSSFSEDPASSSSTSNTEESAKQLLLAEDTKDDLCQVNLVESMIMIPFPSEARPSIQSLPDEMLSETFSYLDHWDRLVARQVCVNWNRVLTNSLAESGVFKFVGHYRDHDSLDSSLAVFKASPVAWRSVKIERVILESLSTAQKFRMGPSRDAEVRRLSLIRCEFSWRLLQALIRIFPNLDKLELVNCQLEVVKHDGFYQMSQEVVEFEKFRNRLKELKLEVIGGVNDLTFYMMKFAIPLEPMCLRSLQIKVNDFQTRITHTDVSEFKRAFSRLLGWLWTIKSLSFGGSYRFAKGTAGAFITFRKMCEEVQAHVPMNLDQLHISWDFHPEPDIPQYNKRAFDIEFLQFLASQPYLTSLAVPPMKCLSSAQEFLDVFPKNLRTLDLGHEAQVTLELFQILTSVKELSVRFHRDPRRLVAATNGNIFPELQSLSLDIRSCPPGTSIMSPIVQAFPNLVKLKISCQTDASSIIITDENLQTIIRHLVHLTSLKLSCCQDITDEGITGIDGACCKMLWENRSFYSDAPLEVLGILRIGFPLSSLRGLQELSLKSLFKPTVPLTDVAIYFGLGFEGLRRLKLKGTKKFTDNGLLQLGKANPGLDRLQIQSGNSWDRSMITNYGIRTLRQALGRMSDSNFSVE